MSFHVGQKVVCVDDRWGVIPPLSLKYVRHLPSNGRVYHVREVLTWRGRSFLRLHEIVNPTPPVHFYTGEAQWDCTHFRPLIERKTDIGIFTSLLNPSNHKPLPEPQHRRQKVSHELCGND